ncbi:ankyrin repeat protein [Tritrichomonas foetus]|uniref:Ankyrin repeat protein n=1 Tax=Tritrichomonas foetus TaxID=1144522 RepID=A0A1J4JIX8_9EUKA|nr:ankyrin repeat protein [Tritrichomonas foetus]|eukprot:OHS98311.1 ankyrin repeat protein [Tritrichomonas foetus]
MNIVTLGSNMQLEIIDNLLADNVDQFIQSISSLEDFNFQFILDLRFPYKLPPILNSGPSLLSLAAFLGAEKCVHHLLNLSINLDLKDHEKRKAVHFACAGGNINICRELYSYGCKFDNSEMDSSKQSPVHYACAFGSLEVCQWLWTRGEKFSSLSCGGHSPYGDAAYHGQLELLKFLTNNVGTLSSKTQINDLFVQASLGGHSHVLEFLFDVYADYDRLENDFFIDAVRSCSISSVKIAFKWIRKLLTRNSTKNSKRTPHSNQNDNIILIIKEGVKVAVNNSPPI